MAGDRPEDRGSGHRIKSPEHEGAAPDATPDDASGPQADDASVAADPGSQDGSGPAETPPAAEGAEQGERGTDREAPAGTEALDHAAEAPTAVFDGHLAGLEDDEDDPPPATQPASNQRPDSVEIDARLSPALEGRRGGGNSAQPRGLSWPATLGLAVALGAAAYFLVRLLV